MKSLLPILILTVLTSCATRAPKQPFNWKQTAYGCAGTFVAGAWHGGRDLAYADYPRFRQLYGAKNRQFYDPIVSWKNKWKNGDVTQGERFPGSSTVFVGVTDWYHLANEGNKYSLLSGGMILTIGERKPFWHYALKFASATVAYSVGFHVIYRR